MQLAALSGQCSRYYVRLYGGSLGPNIVLSLVLVVSESNNADGEGFGGIFYHHIIYLCSHSAAGSDNSVYQLSRTNSSKP